MNVHDVDIILLMLQFITSSALKSLSKRIELLQRQQTKKRQMFRLEKIEFSRRRKGKNEVHYVWMICGIPSRDWFPDRCSGRNESPGKLAGVTFYSKLDILLMSMYCYVCVCVRALLHNTCSLKFVASGERTGCSSPWWQYSSSAGSRWTSYLWRPNPATSWWNGSTFFLRSSLHMSSLWAPSSTIRFSTLGWTRTSRKNFSRYHKMTISYAETIEYHCWMTSIWRQQVQKHTIHCVSKNAPTLVICDFEGRG